MVRDSWGRKFGDENGMFWDDQNAGDKVSIVGVLPEIEWVAPNPDQFPRFREAKRMAVDVETRDENLKSMGPGVRRGGYIVGLSIAIEDGPAYYYPIRHKGGGNLEADLVLGWFKEESDKFEGEIVGANILYDLDYLAEQQITFPKAMRFIDVQIAEFLIDENQYEYNLEKISRKYLGEGKDEDLLKRVATLMGFGSNVKSNIWQIPGHYVGFYAEADARNPLEILKKQLPQLEKMKLMRVFNIECDLIPMMLYMRRSGVRVDLKRRDEVREQLVVERQNYFDTASNMVGHIIEPWKPATFAQDLVARGLQVPLTKVTKVLSVTKPWMEMNAHDQLVDAILQGRIVDKVIGTFIDGYLVNHIIGERLHCEFNQAKARTGRFSSSHPNLQNLPARDAHTGPLIRSLFIPNEGARWVKFDWSQIEYRFLAHYAIGTGADEIRELYRNNPDTDFHDECMAMCIKFGMTKLDRGSVKSVNFGVVYGSGTETTAKSMGVEKEEAEVFLKQYHEVLPFVKETARKATNIVLNKGYTRTILGRRRRFDLWEPRRYSKKKVAPLPLEHAKKEWGRGIKRAGSHKGLNAIIQGSAAEMMKKAMVEIWQNGICDVIQPLLTVHDELDWSVPSTNEAEEALRHVKEIMENCIPLLVPVKADMSQGKNWGMIEGRM